MQIESRIKRKNGHSVEFGKHKYQFLPDTEPPYVADVTVREHIDILLAIPEGYRVFIAEGEQGEDGGATAPVVEPKTGEIILLGSDVHPSSFEINGKEYSLGDVVRLAFEASGLTGEDWNKLGEGDRADLIDAALDSLAADTNGDGEVDASEERAALVKQYEEKFGKKPHHKAGIEKIRAELEAAQ